MMKRTNNPLTRLRASLAAVAMVGLAMFAMNGFADPLAATREVLKNDVDLKAQADSLVSPAAIYEFVRNTHEYALYHGSRANSTNTFLGRRGSDVDIASVLIAMYRSQDYPARYAVGTVSAPAADVANWLGVRNIDLAAAILDDQGIQNSRLTPDRAAIEFEHVWVQVQVPFESYRGVTVAPVNCTTTPERCRWIDVDPSYKLRGYNSQAIDIYNVVNFDYDRYYNAIKNNDSVYRDKNPLEIYENLVLDYLKTNYPGKTLEDVADTGAIIPATEGILPGSLPYRVTSAVNTYDSIVDHDAVSGVKSWAKFVSLRTILSISGIQFSAGGGQIALADVSTQRLTMSVQPQTSGQAGQFQVRLGGTVIATPLTVGGTVNGQLIGIGTPFALEATLDGAPATTTSGTDRKIVVTYENLIVGGYYLIGTGGDTSNWSQVHRAADQLLAANRDYPIINNASQVPYVDANNNGVIDAGEARLLDSPEAQDALTGGLLYVAMSQYFAHFVDGIRRLDALNHVISPIEGFIGVVSSTYEVDYLNDTAFSVMPGGLLIDMKGQSFTGSWRYDQPAAFANKNFEQIGHVVSSLEHEIWQELTGFDAVSTVRGMQMALAGNASLQRPQDTGSGNNMTSQYAGFQFSNGAAPSGFTYAPLTVFSTQPATWTHATSGASMEILRTVVSSSSSSAQRALATYSYYPGSGLYGWAKCVDDYENQLLTFPSTATISTFTFCDGTQYSGQASTILSQIQSNYLNNIIPNYIGQAFFNYFDRAQGFNPANHVFRALPLASDQQRGSMVQVIRDNVMIGTPGVRWEYALPSRKTQGDLFRFTVYLEKIYERSSGNLASQSYKISNDQFSAGGGWVDGANAVQAATSLPGTSVIQPTFNNAAFTDKMVVSQTNNDLIKTPSTADPVSTVTGNMYHDETDFAIKGRGLNYTFTRSYNSAPARADLDGPLGFGWVHSYGMTLHSNDYGACPNCASGTGAGKAPENGNNKTSSITFTDERGGDHSYLVNETTFAVTPPSGEFDTLQFDTPAAGQITLLFRNGVKYVFGSTTGGSTTLKTAPNQTAALLAIQDPYGNQLTLTYDGSGRLSNIVDNLGVSGRTGLTFAYWGTTKHIQTVSDWTGRSWSFTYDNTDGSGNLRSVTNAMGTGYTQTYTYAPDTHLLETVALPENRGGQPSAVTYAYYRNNKTFNHRNTLGFGETLDYDLYRQRTQVTDPRGFIRKYFYDTDNGALTQLEEPDGAVLRFANNADGLRYSKTDGLNYTTRYSYQADRSISAAASDNFGRVSRETDPLGNSTDFNYGVHDQPTVTTDKKGNVATRTYYGSTNSATGAVAGKLMQVSATVNGTPNVVLESYRYFADSAQKNFGQVSRRIETIDPADAARQRITDFTYTADGINVLSMTVSGATSGGSIVKSFTYDTLGRVQTETLSRRASATDSSMLNLTTTYGYDNLGRLISTTTARGDIFTTSYDKNGQVYQKIGRYKQSDDSFITRTLETNQYDAADRLIATTDVLNKTTSFAYDGGNNLTARTDANGHITRYEYDSLNRQTAMIDGNGFRTEKTYDLAGNLVAIRNPNGEVTKFEYDPLGRQTKIITPLELEARTNYDANGNATGMLDANAIANSGWPRNSQGKSLYRTFDEFNRKKTELDAQNGTTSYTYDLLGNITSITDAVGQVTTFIYDDLGRLVQTKDPLVETPTDKTDQVTLYDEAGNVLTTTDRSGRQTRRSYDELNRLTTIEYLQDGSLDVFLYDAFGDLILIANPEVGYYYSYSPRHEMLSKTDTRFNKSLQWTYDAVGNLFTKTDYQGKLTTFQYDSANRLVAEQNADFLQVSYHYDAAGRLVDRLLSNGAATMYQYDADGRLIKLKNITADGTLISNQTFQRDAVGNILQHSDPVNGKTANYTYDGTYRLLTVNSTTASDNRTYTYDTVGNRKTVVQFGTTYYYCYQTSDCTQAPQGNRLVNIRTGSLSGALYRQFSYDDSGRLLQKQDGGGTAIYSATYNGKGRPSQITSANANTFAYDSNDYRIRKVDSGGTRQYHLEGEHLEATYNQNGQLVDKYLRGAVIDEIVNGYHYPTPGSTTGWQNYTYHHDQINSVTALSGPNGGVEDQTGFDPFGMITSSTQPGSGNTLLYTGREYDRDTGLYYYRARYYDPEIGRFISEDPKGFGAGVNFYAYVNNNPINANDPMGKDGVNIGVSGKIFGLGGSLGLSLRFPGIAQERWDLQLKVGLTPGFVMSEIIGYLDPENPFAKASEGLDFAKITADIGYDWSQSSSGVDVAPEVFAGIDLLGGTLGFDGAWTENPSQYPTSFDLNIGPQIRSGAQLEAQFTASLRDVGNAISNIGSNAYDSIFGGSSGGANGGFVLYPNKPNTNAMQQVYAK